MARFDFLSSGCLRSQAADLKEKITLLEEALQQIFNAQSTRDQLGNAIAELERQKQQAVNDEQYMLVCACVHACAHTRVMMAIDTGTPAPAQYHTIVVGLGQAAQIKAAITDLSAQLNALPALDSFAYDDDDDDELCVICFEYPKCYMFTNCRHVCVCEQCAAKTMATAQTDAGWLCPLCRRPSHHILPVTG